MTRFRTILTAVSVACSAVLLAHASLAGDNSSVLDEAAAFDFAVPPYLQAPSPTSMTVVWLMNHRDSLGWVEYGEGDDLSHKAFASESGLIDADDHIHKITLPDLKPGTQYSYRAVAKEIREFGAYSITYGETKTSSIFSFRTPDVNERQKRVSFLVFNDIHQNILIFHKLLSLAKEEPYELAFFNGDVMGHIDHEVLLVNGIIEPLARAFEGQTPYVYVRGNHDARGRFARHLMDYMETPSDHFYHAFRYGPIYFVIMDLGEDKPDDHAEYGGLVNFTPYREAQGTWLAKEIESEAFQSAPFRVLLSHIPLIGGGHTETQCKTLWGETLEAGRFDVHIAGHWHRSSQISKAPVPLNCPALIGGGPKPGGATVIRGEATAKKLRLVMIGDDGEAINELTLESTR